MSCVEVFGGTVTDLLGGGEVGAWSGVAARAVQRGMADVVVSSEAHALSLLGAAHGARKRAETEMNLSSSRAHCLVLLTLVQRGGGGEGQEVSATLTLADLVSE